MRAQDIIDQAFLRTGRGAERTDHFKAQNALMLLNETQKDFLLRTKLYYGTFQTVAKISTRTYQIPTGMFEPVEVHMRQWIAGAGAKGQVIIGRLSLSEDLSQLPDGWGVGWGGTDRHASIRAPYGWYMAEGVNVLGFWPVVTAASYVGTMTVYGYRTASDLTAGAVPTVLPQFHYALTDGLISRLEPSNSPAYAEAIANYQAAVKMAEVLPKPPYHFQPGDKR